MIKHMFLRGNSCLWEEAAVFVNSCNESDVLIRWKHLFQKHMFQKHLLEKHLFDKQLLWRQWWSTNKDPAVPSVSIIWENSCLYCERKHLFSEKQLFEGKEQLFEKQLLWVIPYGFESDETDACWLLVTWPNIIKTMILNVILYTWKR